MTSRLPKHVKMTSLLCVRATEQLRHTVFTSFDKRLPRDPQINKSRFCACLGRQKRRRMSTAQWRIHFMEGLIRARSIDISNVSCGIITRLLGKRLGHIYSLARFAYSRSVSHIAQQTDEMVWFPQV